MIIITNILITIITNIIIDDILNVTSSQCHCNDGWGGKGCSMPDDNECKYR